MVAWPEWVSKTDCVETVTQLQGQAGGEHLRDGGHALREVVGRYG